MQDTFYSKFRGIVEKDSSLYKLFLDDGASNNESENRNIGTRIVQRLIANDPYYLKIFSSKLNYWIIYHKSDSLIGSLTKNEYLDKKRTMHIPDSLKLKFEIK